MTVILVNRFAGGQATPTGRMLADVARELLARGAEVLVLTSRGRYADEEGALPQGVQLRHLGGASGGRLWQWLSFWVHVMLALPSLARGPCLLMTDPPFLSLAALPAFCLGRGPFFLWTMDLYPEALVASGRLWEGSLLHRVLVAAHRWSLLALRGLVVLGECQWQRLQQHEGWMPARSMCLTVPPWDERPLPRVEKSNNPWLRREGFANCKIALYAGNLGEGHESQALVEVARLLHQQQRGDWRIVMVCRGSGVAGLRRDIAGLSTICVMDYVAADEAAALLWGADVHLITMKEHWSGVIVPSKLQGVLKTAAPVLFIGPPNSGTALEILRLNRGEVLRAEATAAEVLEALERQVSRSGLLPVLDDRTGARTVADFLLGEGKPS